MLTHGPRRSKTRRCPSALGGGPLLLFEQSLVLIQVSPHLNPPQRERRSLSVGVGHLLARYLREHTLPVLVEHALDGVLGNRGQPRLL